MAAASSGIMYGCGGASTTFPSLSVETVIQMLSAATTETRPMFESLATWPPNPGGSPPGTHARYAFTAGPCGGSGLGEMPELGVGDAVPAPASAWWISLTRTDPATATARNAETPAMTARRTTNPFRPLGWASLGREGEVREAVEERRRSSAEGGGVFKAIGEAFRALGGRERVAGRNGMADITEFVFDRSDQPVGRAANQRLETCDGILQPGEGSLRSPTLCPEPLERDDLSHDATLDGGSDTPVEVETISRRSGHRGRRADDPGPGGDDGLVAGPVSHVHLERVRSVGEALVGDG